MLRQHHRVADNALCRWLAAGMIIAMTSASAEKASAQALEREELIGTFDLGGNRQRRVQSAAAGEAISAARRGYAGHEPEDAFQAAAGDRVFFGQGSPELGARARKVLSAQAAWLKQHADFVAVIEGHADEPGSEGENAALSVARAGVVRSRLISEGVEPDRLSIIAFGRTRRVAPCAGPDCAAQNRRSVTRVARRRATPLGSAPPNAALEEQTGSLAGTDPPARLSR